MNQICARFLFIFNEIELNVGDKCAAIQAGDFIICFFTLWCCVVRFAKLQFKYA